MPSTSLLHIYKEVSDKVATIFVVPLIRYDYPTTDYLYLLYKDLLADKQININSLSAFAHIKLILAPLTDKHAILHYHWLEFQDLKSGIGLIYKLICITLFKAFGGSIIWTVHNLYPHNKKWRHQHKKLYQWFAGICDMILVHTPKAVELVSKEYEVDSKKIRVYPHPQFPARFIEKTEAVSHINTIFGLQLTPKIPTIGCFGAISAYKRYPELIGIVDQLSVAKQMIIAGYVKKGMQEIDAKILESSKSRDWLYYHRGFISEDLLPNLMNAIDVCVFNFDDILTSGGIELALAYNKPVVAPRLEALMHYETHSNVHLFNSENECVELITQLITG